MTDGVVLITTSPIPSHPSTAIIDQTIASVRERTDWPVLVLADGVRPELETLRPSAREDYREYLNVLHGRYNQRGPFDVEILMGTGFNNGLWLHQAACVRGVIDVLNDDDPEGHFPNGAPELLLFVEHDTPLVGDWPVRQLCAPLLSGEANVVRLYHEKVIQPEHATMFVGDAETVAGLRLQRTRQWSQRPHLARVAYYRRVLDAYFPPDARTMIEDRMHGVLENAPWTDHRVWMWLPEGDYPDGTGLGVQRSDHLDGRQADPKFEMRW